MGHIALLLATMGFAGRALAQETTGTITGVATDQTGAVLPGVTVTVKHVQTSRTQEFVTNQNGIYTASLLQPGEYEITFALTGFQPMTNRANLVGDPKAGQLDFPFWFDPTAFAPPADGTYGSPTRVDSLRFPGRNQTNLALSKNFYSLNRRLQFRADFINAFNHTQWSTVDNACSAASTVTLNRCDIGGTDTFGQITATRLPREIQFSLKLFW